MNQVLSILLFLYSIIYTWGINYKNFMESIPHKDGSNTNYFIIIYFICWKQENTHLSFAILTHKNKSTN